MPENDPVRPDGFELIKGGTARVWVDGDMRQLRRPKHGTYKKLVLKARQRDDELAQMRHEAAAETEWQSDDGLPEAVLAELRAIIESVELDGVTLSDEQKQALVDAADAKRPEPSREKANELLTAAREFGRKISDRQTELHAEWMRVVFNGDETLEVRGLSDKAMPDDVDEWPEWLFGPDLPGTLIRHWASEPLGPTQP